MLWSASGKLKPSCAEKTPRHYCENIPTTPFGKISTAQFDEAHTSQLATTPRFHTNRSGESSREQRGTLHLGSWLNLHDVSLRCWKEKCFLRYEQCGLKAFRLGFTNPFIDHFTFAYL